MDHKEAASLHISYLPLDTTPSNAWYIGGILALPGPLSTPACTSVPNFQPLCAPEPALCSCAKPFYNHPNGEASCMPFHPHRAA